MKNLRLLLATLILALPSAAHAEETALHARVRSGLEYLREQQTHGGSDGYDPGQWRTEVTSTLPSMIGVGRYGEAFEEPTIFGAASVANVLAEIRFLDSSYEAIPPMVSKALTGFAPYRWGPVFHFYPPSTYRGVSVRSPRFMFLQPEWYGFTNTPPDADDTSVGYLLLAYEQSIRDGKSPLDSGFPVPSGALKELSSYRDINRDPHIYNGIHGDENTGAFLTWLWDEKDPKMPRDYFASPDKGTRIPFDKNDVDCVVNTNVLKALTATKNQSTPGYRSACAWVNAVAAKSELYTCGMYYPSEFALPYAVASALTLGVKCLEPSRDRFVKLVLDLQLEDGSWKNHWKNPHPDFVQSTAWALSTLLQLGNPRDPVQRAAAQRGLKFLLANAKKDAHGHLYWNGEIFYAAIFIARKPVVWRSSPYTTAVALKALALADDRWGLR